MPIKFTYTIILNIQYIEIYNTNLFKVILVISPIQQLNQIYSTFLANITTSNYLTQHILEIYIKPYQRTS